MNIARLNSKKAEEDLHEYLQELLEEKLTLDAIHKYAWAITAAYEVGRERSD
jgi:hypothetical protein